ncbi:MAG: hypothetical protein MUE85_12540 [Microscillaceae bacterium]|jgi:hypothetical protein|nr:hypothetical protein [Microscillaceae bacterium]
MKNLIFLLFLGCTLPAFAQKLPFQFDAKGLLVLSDADMVASAYADGKLKTEQGVDDQLSIIKWGVNLEDFNLKTLAIPNSVTNWVNGLALANDGKTAFVIDTRGSLPRSVQQVKDVFTDLPAGKTLYAIDISDLQNPNIRDKIEVGSTPLSVDVNPLNQTLLICGVEKGREIQLIEWQNGKFGKIHSFAQDHKITHANWHPSGKFIGITLEKTQQVQFYQVDKKL